MIPSPESKLLTAEVVKLEQRGARMRMTWEGNQSVECYVDLSAIAHATTLSALADSGAMGRHVDGERWVLERGYYGEPPELRDTWTGKYLDLDDVVEMLNKSRWSPPSESFPEGTDRE